MTNPHPICGASQCFYATAFILGLAATSAQTCIAQQKGKIPNALNRNQAEVVEDPDPKKVDDAPMMQFDMEPERWLEMAYGTAGGTRATFEQSLRRRVRKTLNRIEQLCGIAEDLRTKVNATADLEFQRLDADITALVSEAPRRPTQQQYQDFYQKLWALIGPFQSGAQWGQSGQQNRNKTLWEKVLYSNLSEDHAEIISNDQRQRSDYNNRVQRLETLLKVSRVLGLDSRQLDIFEKIADANPDAWISLETAWTTLAAMPDTQQREYFTETQRIRLSRPLEYTNDLQPVMNWNQPE
jgi:hypothetical protein